MRMKNVKDIYPLTPLQEGMLYDCVSSDNSSLYLNQLSWTFSGNLNVTAWKFAWQRVVERQPILRTAFIWEGLQKPLQVVRGQVELPWIFEDWRHFSPQKRANKLDEYLNAEMRSEFNFSKAPLMRICLLQLDETVFKFIWTFHHILLDGWSLEPLLNEISSFYSICNSENNHDLPPPLSFRDFISWIQKQDLSDAEKFWRDRLKSIEPSFLNIKSFLKEKNLEKDYGELKTELSENASQNIIKFAQQNQLTLNTIFQAAWAIVLSRLQGRKEVIFGAVVSGRTPDIAGIEKMIGIFINTIPVRIKIDSKSKLIFWLKNIQNQQANAIPYHHTPLVEIKKWCGIPRNRPLFDSIYIFENYPIENSTFTGFKHLTVSDIKFKSYTDYPLHIRINPQKKICVDIIYKRHHFDKSTVQSIIDQLLGAVQFIVSNPGQDLKELLKRNTKQFTPRTPIPKILPGKKFLEFRQQEIEQSLINRFDQIVYKFPQNIAVETRKYNWTYQELSNKVNQIASVIIHKNVDPSEKIALLFDHDAPMIAAILGVLKTGCAYVPLDPSFPQKRLIYMLNDADINTIITNSNNMDVAFKLKTNLRRIINIDEEQLGVDNMPEYPKYSADYLAYILYTSGSTGKPKGVMQNHRNVLHHIRNYTNNLQITSNDRLSLLASYSFDAAIMDIFGALLNGATLSLFDQKYRNLEELADWLIDQKITVYHSTPTVYRFFMNTLTENHFFPDLRCVVLGGEEVLANDFYLFQKHFSETCIFINGFGPTECTLALQYFMTSRMKSQNHKIPIGYPVEGVEVTLLNKDGEPDYLFGEIALRSSHVSLGYWNKPELTKKIFHNNDSQNSLTTYRTGDLGKMLPDGSIEYMGRKDNQIKIRGYRIEPVEIETRLRELSPVKDVIVLVKENHQGNKKLIAYIISQTQSPLNIVGLKTELKKTLPDYMIPSEFIALGRFPLSPTGKVDKQALLSINHEPSQQDTDSTVLPESSMEKLIAEIWAGVLDTNHILLTDNFFDLGGHSLLAMQVVSQLKKKSGYRINPRLLAYHTLEQLAAIYEEQENNSDLDSSNNISRKITKTIKTSLSKNK